MLFIDEIHRMSPAIEEILYPAMEDYQIDIMIGEGPSARSIKLDLPPFTLIGATTRAGLLTSPLRDRFGIVQRLRILLSRFIITNRLTFCTVIKGNCQTGRIHEKLPCVHEAHLVLPIAYYGVFVISCRSERKRSYLPGDRAQSFRNA